LSVFIPTPGDNFEDWVNNLRNEFLNYNVPLAPNVDNWQDWAETFLFCNPSFANFPNPDKSLYPNKEDWKKWAEFFVNNIYTQY
jgi:hypothetical protein